MNTKQVNVAILSQNQILICYLQDNVQASSSELRAVTGLRNVAAAIASLNSEFLPRRGLPEIRRSRDDKGRAVYSWGVQ